MSIIDLESELLFEQWIGKVAVSRHICIRKNDMGSELRIFRKGLFILREQGVLALCRRISEHLWELERTALLEFELSSPPSSLNRTSSPVKFCWAKIEDLEGFNNDSLHFSGAELRDAFQWLCRGDLCLIGYVKGSLATYLWITFSVRELPAFRWPVGAHTAFFFKTFTRPSFRGMGLNQEAFSFALNYCYTLGIRRVFIDVNKRNASSFRAISNVGFKEIGTFFIFRLGRWRFTRVPTRLYRCVVF